MAGLKGHIVRELSLIHGFKDGQSLTHGGNPDAFEALCVHKAQSIAGYIML